MRDDSSIPTLKRRRVDSGSVLVPDGFTPSKGSRQGKAAAPSFHSAFESSKKPRNGFKSPDNHLLALTTTNEPAQRPEYLLDSQFPSAQVANDSSRIVSMPTKPTHKATVALAHVTSGKRPIAMPNGLSVRPASPFMEARSTSYENQPDPAMADSSSSSTKPISSTKPKSKISILVPKQDTTSISRTPTKPLLKSLVPPRFPTPKPAIGQKVPLPPPPPLSIHLPGYTTTTPSKTLRNIATTRMARAIDLSTENGTAELASIVLQNPSELEHADIPEMKSGLNLSPQKGNSFGRGPKFARNGLASHAASILSHANTSLALWAKECSTLSRLPKADLRLRVTRIIHCPLKETHAPSNIGLALCRLLDKKPSFLDQDARPGAATAFPILNTHEDNNLSSSSTALVLFSFSSRPSPSSTPIRNAEDFKEDVEFWIWKPWRTLTLGTSQIRSLSTLVGHDQDGGLGESGGDARGVESIALFCDRFGRYGARTDGD